MGAAWLGSIGRKFLRKNRYLLESLSSGGLKDESLPSLPKGLTGRAGVFVPALGRHLSFSPHGLLEPSLLGYPPDRRSKPRSSRGAAMLFMTYPLKSHIPSTHSWVLNRSAPIPSEKTLHRGEKMWVMFSAGYYTSLLPPHISPVCYSRLQRSPQRTSLFQTT